MPQRRADEDEIEGAESEDTPETTERQRPATEEELKEYEREGVYLADLAAAAARQRSATEEEIQQAEEENADSDRPSDGLLPNEPHHADRPRHADQRIADEDEIEAAERKAER